MHYTKSCHCRRLCDCKNILSVHAMLDFDEKWNSLSPCSSQHKFDCGQLAENKDPSRSLQGLLETQSGHLFDLWTVGLDHQDFQRSKQMYRVHRQTYHQSLTTSCVNLSKIFHSSTMKPKQVRAVRHNVQHCLDININFKWQDPVKTVRQRNACK